jgi:hypothetical protein
LLVLCIENLSIVKNSIVGLALGIATYILFAIGQKDGSV